jgi:hypothetical protein
LNPRSGFITPNQDFNNIAAISNYNEYRLFDRWSPIEITVDAPNINIDSMEIIDLDIWKSDFHSKNIEIESNKNVLFQHSGKFSSYKKINVAGKIYQGKNTLVLTQEDILGGQVLINFPLNPVYNCICGKVALNDTNLKLDQVSITITVDLSKIIHPDTIGLYCFDSLLNGDYEIKASLNNFNFTPMSYTFNDLKESYYEKDFNGIKKPDNIIENSFISKIALYPNPTNDVIYILNNDKVESIEILNVFGEKIHIYPNKSSIELKDFAKGFYLLKFIDENGQTLNISKIIKN